MGNCFTPEIYTPLFEYDVTPENASLLPFLSTLPHSLILISLQIVLDARPSCYFPSPFSPPPRNYMILISFSLSFANQVASHPLELERELKKSLKGNSYFKINKLLMNPVTKSHIQSCKINPSKSKSYHGHPTNELPCVLL
jgi:hypothetical protein